MLLVFILFWLSYIEGCSRRNVDSGIICVCNSTYCDTVEKLETPGITRLKIYYTSATSPGFNVNRATFSNVKNASATVLRVESKTTYQRIIGFGGAFTDSTGINIARLPVAAQKHLLESYFGASGIEYSLCRVPIGGTDFSTRPYSYDDVDGDRNLKHFKLQTEDYHYKVSKVDSLTDETLT